jgi:hypothetical protein
MVFLDELNLADKSTLDAAQTLLTHGELGSFQLSQHTVLLGAQNPPDMVGGTPISPAAASRWLHVAWAPVAVGDFATYLESMPSWYDEVSPQETEVKLMTPQEADDLLKDQWPGMFRFAGKKVAQFLRQVPNLFYKLPPVGDKARQYAWPCSRTWVMFTRVLAGCKIFNTSDRVRILLLQGCVGKEATTAFLEWYRKSDQLPTIEQVLKGEWVPDRKAVDIAHAVHVNLLEWIDKQKDEVLESNIQTLWKLIPLFYRASLPDLASAYQKGLESRKLFLMDRVLLMDIMRQSADIRKAAGLVPIGRKHGA